MARTNPELDTQSPVYQEFAAYLKRTMEQEQQARPLIHFSEIESYAMAIGNIVAREVYSNAASQQAFQAFSTQPCPDCGKDCTSSIQARDLQTRCGPVSVNEAKYHCPRCRRDFFPLPTKPGPDSSELQPKADRGSGHVRRRRVVRSVGSADSQPAERANFGATPSGSHRRSRHGTG